MKELRVICILVLIGTVVLLAIPQSAQAADCFASDRGAGSTNKTDHATWARQQSLDTLVSNLWAKIKMVYNCSEVSKDAADAAFADISLLVATRAPDAGCFNGDRGIINTDWEVHVTWAHEKWRAEVRDHLGAKSAAALKCLNAGTNRTDFFAEASTILAKLPPIRTGPNGLRFLLEDKRFVPTIATVKDGDTIEICNKDQFYHNPFSFSVHNQFGTPKGIQILPGQCMTRVARNPTTENIPFNIFDELHSLEKLLLTVLPLGIELGKDDPPKPPTGVTPCGPGESAAWAKMLGTWDAPYGDITFAGSCEKVSGYWRQGAYGDKGTLHRGEIKGGRVTGTTVTFSYYQDWNNKTGTTSYNLIGNTMEGSSGWGTLKRK